MVSIAKKNHPNLSFLTGDIEEKDLFSRIDKTFDFVVLSDTVAYLEDIQVALENLSSVITNETRIIIATHSKFWEPFLYIAQLLRLKSPQTIQNNLTIDDISNFIGIEASNKNLIILLFGAKRLPDSARSLGKSLKIFKSEMKDMKEDKKPDQDGQASA